MNSEFDLIQHYFTQLTPLNDSVALGIGDDAAILNVPTNQQLVVSVDTLVEGRHFFADTNPYHLGHKALAVNLSDLAAMGATPNSFTLALCLPRADPVWLTDFCKGLADLAKQFNVTLIGGDTTRGHKTVSIQVMGFTDKHHAILRSGAKPDHDIYISGQLGNAGFALQQIIAQQAIDEQTKACLERPTPRVDLGLALVGIASAMIDVSDGLVADLGHICDASSCGAEIYLAQLPLSKVLQQQVAKTNWALPLSGGEDYELCFSAPPTKRKDITAISNKLSLMISRIGKITENKGLNIFQADNTRYTSSHPGFDHFLTD